MEAYCGGLLFLAALVKEDLAEKQIAVYRLCLFGILALAFFWWKEGFVCQELVRRLLPGVGLLVIAFITKESIGYGDGLAVMVLGLWTGAIFAVLTLFIGVLAAGIWSVICLLRKRTEPIPFIPFLLLGMEVVLLGV